MDKKLSATFFLLVLFQGFHSIEEYVGKLWDVFPPAKFLTSLISQNHETGFLVINIGLFIFGLWCWFFPVRKNYSYTRSLIWFWIVIEIINGISHPLWALFQWSYEPGVITAPVLLFLAIYLTKQLTHLTHPAEV